MPFHLQFWLFGGIERVSKKKFVIALKTEDAEKFIWKGSIIVSDCWRACSSLSEYVYVHRTINHSEIFVDPEDREVHTQNIERLRWDIKEWTKLPGMRAQYLDQYLRSSKVWMKTMTTRCSTSSCASLVNGTLTALPPLAASRRWWLRIWGSAYFWRCPTLVSWCQFITSRSLKIGAMHDVKCFILIQIKFSN